MTLYRGHEVKCDGMVWRYLDGVPVPEDKDRACGFCKMENTPEGHDGCLGTLIGVRNACCGHGDDMSSYVQFTNLTRLDGEEAQKWFKKLGRGPYSSAGGSA